MYCVYRLCCLETHFIAYIGYVAWRHSVLNIQAVLPGAKLCCLCRDYDSWRKAILSEFLCAFLPRFPPGTCCDTISHLTTITCTPLPFHYSLIIVHFGTSVRQSALLAASLIIIINCNWVVSRWQRLFYVYTKYEFFY